MQLFRGERLRHIRKQRGLTQGQVGERLNEALVAVAEELGWPRAKTEELRKKNTVQGAHISQLECEKKRPSIEKIEALALILDCKPQDFFNDGEGGRLFGT